MKRKTFHVQTPVGEIRVVLEWPRNAAAWYYRFTIKGQRHYKTTHKADAGEARAVAETAAQEAGKHTFSPATKRTLDDLLALYLKHKDSKVTLILNRFRKHATGTRAFAAMQEEDATTLIAAYLDTRRSTASVTQRNERVCISGFCAWLMTERIGELRISAWRVNPASAKLHRKIKIQKQPRAPLTAELLQRVLTLAPSMSIYPSLILILSGLRPAGTTRAEITFGQTSTARTTEKGKPRLVTLSPWAVRELQAWKKAHPKTPMLERSVQMLHNKLRAFRELVGLPAEVTLQSLRRTASWKLYQAGINPQIEAGLMDHSVNTALRHYVDWKRLDPKTAHTAFDYSSECASEKTSENP